jgi:hypothetical protein
VSGTSRLWCRGLRDNFLRKLRKSLSPLDIRYARWLRDSRHENRLEATGLKNNYWIRLQELFVSLERQEKTLYEMDSIQLGFIWELAYKCPPDRASFSAQSIIHLLFGEAVPECEIFTTRRTTRLVKDVNFVLPESDAYIEDNYPDPFTDKTYIDYYVPEGSEGIIFINDMYGRKLAEHKALVGENILTVEKGNLAPGIYTYGLIVDGQIIEFKKLIINQ